MSASRLDCVGSQSLLQLNYEAAVAGLGVALLPPEFVSTDSQRLHLQQLHPKRMVVGRAYYFCWPHDSLKAQALEALGQWIAQMLEVSCDQEKLAPLSQDGPTMPAAGRLPVRQQGAWA